MKKLLVLLLLCISAGEVKSSAEKLRITGLANDVHSGARIAGVAFYTMNENRRVLLSSTDAEGRFSFDLLSDGTKLIVEKKGYRQISTSISTYRNAGKRNDFFVKIPLIPLDMQSNDTPYMQSEQKEYTVEGHQNNKTGIVRKFVVSDAVSGTPVKQGTLCFEFTRAGRKECKELNTEPVMSFEDADIVGFTVSAEGYQSYTGNLILEKMDEKPGKYDVKLTPEITMLSLNISGNPMVASCRLTADAGPEIKLPLAEKSTFFAMVRAGNYDLKVFDKKSALIYSEKVAVAKGLNFLGIVVAAKPVAVKENVVEKPVIQPATTILADSLENLTIYFNQGDYTFKPDEQAKLDALAEWLKSNANQKVRVVGHTDNVGNPKLNITLSEFRAKVIRHYLLSKKVSERQILWVGVGGKYPAVKNDTETNKRMNRRVEISMVQ
jgi:outer membrane protein OmpA-like peptidoglycan-associated protein